MKWSYRKLNIHLFQQPRRPANDEHQTDGSPHRAGTSPITTQNDLAGLPESCSCILTSPTRSDSRDTENAAGRVLKPFLRTLLNLRIEPGQSGPMCIVTGRS